MSDLPQDNEQKFIAALEVFTDKYEPGTVANLTDFFTSKQILHSIQEHTGVEIPLMDLHTLLSDMGYGYELQGDMFVWKCFKVA